MNGILRVLIIENIPSDAYLVVQELHSAGISCEWRRVEYVEEFRTALEEFQPNIIIADYDVALSFGTSAFDNIQNNGLPTPLIVLSRSIPVEEIIRTLPNGAVDCIHKSTMYRLGITVKSSMEVASEHREFLQMKEELLESEARYRLLFELSPDAIVVHSEGKIVMCNEAGAREFGAERASDFIGMPVMNFVHPDSREIVVERMKSMMELGVPAPPVEEKLLRLDGETLIVETSAAPLMYHGKKAIQVVVRNITGRKEAEKALITAKERAEEADKFKTMLLGNMNHELRTPMNGILGFTSILAEEAENEELRSFAILAQKSAQRLMGTLNNIVQLAFLEAGNANYSMRNISLPAEVSELIENFTPQCEEKGLDMQQEIEKNGVLVYADPTLLHAILFNLLENAIKFTIKGGIFVRVFSTECDGLAYNAVEIKDNGIGISEDFLPKIHEPFSQEDGSISRQFEGTGLGLAIVKRALDTMGGKIEVRSTKDIGSTFTVLFPSV